MQSNVFGGKQIKIYRIGKWKIIPELNQISDQDREFEVEPKAMETLLVLMANEGVMISRQQLLNEVWGESVVTENSVDQAIARLRKVLGDNAKSPTYIATVTKKGYRLLPGVEYESDVLTQPAKPLDSDAIKNIEDDEVLPIEKTVKSSKSQFMYVGAGLVALALVFVYANWNASIPPSIYSNKAPYSSLVGPEYSLSISSTSGKRAFIWESPGSTGSDVYISDSASKTLEQMTFSHEVENSVDINPDGGTLAFVRYSPEVGCRVYIMDVQYKKEELIADCGPTHLSKVKWSADGNILYFVGREKESQPFHLYSLSIETGKLAQLTNATQGTFGDYQMDISSDGKRLAYLRSERWSHSQIRVLELDSGIDSTFYESQQMLLDINWGVDNKHLLTVTGSNFGRLVQIDSAGVKQTLSTSLNRLSEPQIINSQANIVLRENQQRKSIYQSGWAVEDSKATKLFSSTLNQWLGTYSPDGKQIAYLSDETGKVEIWLMDEKGNVHQLTNNQLTGISQIKWSPNGAYILLDAHDDGIHRLTLSDLSLTKYTHKSVFAKNPSWHSDSQGIYFSSDMSGDWQLWYQASPQEKPEQITKQGGFTARMNNSGEYLYYTKFYQDGVWRKTLSNNRDADVLIIEKIQPGISAQWQLTDNSIYYAKHVDGALKLFKFSLNSNIEQFIITLPHIHYMNFSYSIDELSKQVIYGKVSRSESDFVLIKK